MKCLVLSSGGIDSTTCVSLAVHEYGKENVATVSVRYGQKHLKELECAEKIAKYYEVPHYELDLSQVFKQSNCALLSQSTEAISLKSYAEQLSENGRVNTYVPFRNGLFLASCASLALSVFNNEKCQIYIGAHADDAAGNAYADCSLEFIDYMNKAIKQGTYDLCEIVAPFVNNNKAEVVKTGIKLKTPYELTWSCYEGGDKPCGKCATCIDRLKAFELNGIKDPAYNCE